MSFRRSSDRPGSNLIARRALRLTALTLVAAGCVALIVAGIAALHLRAAADVPAAAPAPIVVETVTARLMGAYQVADRFAGRLEPARHTPLAFERTGLLRRVFFDEGAEVGAGDVVAELDTAKFEAERERLVAQRGETYAQVELAELTRARRTQLAKSGHQSLDGLDQARLEVVRLKASLATIVAGIRSLDVDIDKSTITAPFAGTIAARSVDEGAVVAAGAPIVELMEMHRRDARIGVAVDSAAALEVGEIYEVEAAGRTLDARLTALRPDLSTGTRTVAALFSVSGAEQIPFGEVVDLILLRTIVEKGYWLPVGALNEARKGLWSVYTVISGANGHVIAREAVQIVHTDGKRVFVRGTLQGGQQVVGNGIHRVIPGQRVALVAGEGGT